MVLRDLIFIGRVEELTFCGERAKPLDDKNGVKRVRVMNLPQISGPVTIVPSKPVVEPEPLRLCRFSKFWEFFTNTIQAMI